MTSDLAFVYHPDYLRHETGSQPERPARAAAVAAAVERAALPGVRMVEPTVASVEQVCRVHSPRYLDGLRRLAASGGGYADLETIVAPGSYDVALLAAGGALRALDLVLSGAARTGFAAIRPPGHHAGRSSAAGFCLLNNVAIAAREAQVVHGLRRVLVVDFDAHHGNGTQAIFEDDPGLLYASVHQYPLYPGTGSLREIGRGAGFGYTINVPVPPGTGDAACERVFSEVFEPAAYRYRPELILVSAGYDGHWRDPLTLLELSAAGFARMVGRLRDWAEDLCGGRIVFVLEGGYDVEALAASVTASLAVLCGVNPVDPFGPSPRSPQSDVGPTIEAVRRANPLWS